MTIGCDPVFPVRCKVGHGAELLFALAQGFLSALVLRHVAYGAHQESWAALCVTDDVKAIAEAAIVARPALEAIFQFTRFGIARQRRPQSLRYARHVVGMRPFEDTLYGHIHEFIRRKTGQVRDRRAQVVVVIGGQIATIGRVRRIFQHVAQPRGGVRSCVRFQFRHALAQRSQLGNELHFGLALIVHHYLLP